MTNSRSLSWIDRGRWAGLLAKVTEPSPVAGRPAPIARGAPPKPRPAMAMPTPRPSVPARPSPPTAPPAPPRTAALPSVPPPPAVPPLAAPPPRAAQPEPLPPPPPAPVKPSYPPFAAPSPHLEERLQALVGWIERCVPCRGAFIADDNGLPVVEHLGAEPGHIAAASSILLLLASVRSLMRDSGGWLSLELGAAVLSVVEVATRWGRFGIGVVTDDALPREFLLALSGAVERAFQGDSSQGESS